jgi:uncharacterized protein YaiE (UPF0345 family)
VCSGSVKIIAFSEIRKVPASVCVVSDGQTTDVIFGQVATERNVEMFFVQW